MATRASLLGEYGGLVRRKFDETIDAPTPDNPFRKVKRTWHPGEEVSPEVAARWRNRAALGTAGYVAWYEAPLAVSGLPATIAVALPDGTELLGAVVVSPEGPRVEIRPVPEPGEPTVAAPNPGEPPAVRRTPRGR